MFRRRSSQVPGSPACEQSSSFHECRDPQLTSLRSGNASGSLSQTLLFQGTFGHSWGPLKVSSGVVVTPRWQAVALLSRFPMSNYPGPSNDRGTWKCLGHKGWAATQQLWRHHALGSVNSSFAKTSGFSWAPEVMKSWQRGVKPLDRSICCHQI